MPFLGVLPGKGTLFLNNEEGFDGFDTCLIASSPSSRVNSPRPVATAKTGAVHHTCASTCVETCGRLWQAPVLEC